MRKLCLIALSLCLILGTFSLPARAGETAQPFEGTVVEFDQVRGIIAAPSLSARLLHQCSRPAPDPKKVSGYWTPDRAILAVLENLLPAYVDRPPNMPLAKYRRVYAGIIYEGRQVIYVDFSYIGGEKSDWMNNVTVWCDGGANFFGIEFDTETQNFSNLWYNGRG